MTTSGLKEIPSVMKRSRTKIWTRAGVLVIFGTIFTLILYRDTISGAFHWSLILISLLPSLLIGIWISRFVPMHVHQKSRYITLSFDRIYFALILLLVIARITFGRLLDTTIWADIIMCVILGLMTGRLGGIGLRVRNLKIQHNFISINKRN